MVKHHVKVGPQHIQQGETETRSKLRGHVAAKAKEAPVGDLEQCVCNANRSYLRGSNSNSTGPLSWEGSK